MVTFRPKNQLLTKKNKFCPTSMKKNKLCCDQRISSWTYAVGHPQRRMIVCYDWYDLFQQIPFSLIKSLHEIGMNGNLARNSYNPTKPGHRLASAGKNNHSIESSGFNTVKTKSSGHQDQAAKSKPRI